MPLGAGPSGGSSRALRILEDEGEPPGEKAGNRNDRERQERADRGGTARLLIDKFQELIRCEGKAEDGHQPNGHARLALRQLHEFRGRKRRVEQALAQPPRIDDDKTVGNDFFAQGRKERKISREEADGPEHKQEHRRWDSDVEQIPRKSQPELAARRTGRTAALVDRGAERPAALRRDPGGGEAGRSHQEETKRQGNADQRRLRLADGRMLGKIDLAGTHVSRGSRPGRWAEDRVIMRKQLLAPLLPQDLVYVMDQHAIACVDIAGGDRRPIGGRDGLVQLVALLLDPVEFDLALRRTFVELRQLRPGDPALERSALPEGHCLLALDRQVEPEILPLVRRHPIPPRQRQIEQHFRTRRRLAPFGDSLPVVRRGLRTRRRTRRDEAHHESETMDQQAGDECCLPAISVQALSGKCAHAEVRMAIQRGLDRIVHAGGSATRRLCRNSAMVAMMASR